MITNSGKSIIAKYMLGQAPAYASYIAVGCGNKPLQTGDAIPDYSEKTNLNFEMFRVPISSRGYVIENDISKIVFTAELPTEERYEISEVGIYSAGFDPLTMSNDSKTILSFTKSETWKNQDGSEIIEISKPLDYTEENNIIETSSVTFRTNADNRIFYNSNRDLRNERCRYLNDVLAIKSNSSNINTSGTHFSVASGAQYIKLTGTSVDFSKNSPKDELRLAFSVVNIDGTVNTNPDKVAIMIEFTGSDTSKFARFEAVLNNGTGLGQQNFTNNRYCVISKQLQELYTTDTFTWNSVNTVNIYACAYQSSAISDDFYIFLDALRFENVSNNNPLYGLTGYSVVQNDTASTIVKTANTSNYIEFRFGIGIG